MDALGFRAYLAGCSVCLFLIFCKLLVSANRFVVGDITPTCTPWLEAWAPTAGCPAPSKLLSLQLLSLAWLYAVAHLDCHTFVSLN